MSDVFGDIIDWGTIERAVVETLKAWMPGHLRHQERRLGFAPLALPNPRSWPVASEFDTEAHEKLPAIFIASPGGNANPRRDQSGAYRATWNIEVAVVIAGRNEAEARNLAGIYLAAIRGALVQNPTLGDVVEHCLWTGPDDHALGVTPRGAQRAIYGTGFDVTVRDVVNQTLGPPTPPPDPTDPPDPPQTPVDFDIELDIETPTPEEEP